MTIEYFQTIRKRDFEENPKNFLTAVRLVFKTLPGPGGPGFPAAGHIVTAFKVKPTDSQYFGTGSYLKVLCYG